MSVRLSSQRNVGNSLSSVRALAREFRGFSQPIKASVKLHDLCLGWASQARNLLQHLSSQHGDTFIGLWTADDSLRKPLSKSVNTIAGTVILFQFRRAGDGGPKGLLPRSITRYLFLAGATQSIMMIVKCYTSKMPILYALRTPPL